MAELDPYQRYRLCQRCRLYSPGSVESCAHCGARFADEAIEIKQREGCFRLVEKIVTAIAYAGAILLAVITAFFIACTAAMLPFAGNDIDWTLVGAGAVIILAAAGFFADWYFRRRRERRRDQ